MHISVEVLGGGGERGEYVSVDVLWGEGTHKC